MLNIFLMIVLPFVDAKLTVQPLRRADVHNTTLKVLSSRISSQRHPNPLMQYQEFPRGAMQVRAVAPSVAARGVRAAAAGWNNADSLTRRAQNNPGAVAVGAIIGLSAAGLFGAIVGALLGTIFQKVLQFQFIQRMVEPGSFLHAYRGVLCMIVLVGMFSGLIPSGVPQGGNLAQMQGSLGGFMQNAAMLKMAMLSMFLPQRPAGWRPPAPRYGPA